MNSTPASRFREDAFQTPVAAYSGPGGSPAVTVIGTVHVGDPAYYEAVRNRAAALESAGSLVQYETLADAPGRQWAAASPDELAARDALRLFLGQLDDCTRLAAPHLGLVPQETGLRYGPAWERADITDLELIRAAGPEAVIRASEAAGKARRLACGHPDPGRLYAAMLALSLRAGPARRLLPAREPRAFRQAVVGRRSRHAIGSLPPGRDAVLIWGAGHVPGLDAMLRRAGYRRRSLDWLTAGRFPGITASTAALRAELRLCASRSPAALARQPGPPEP